MMQGDIPHHFSDYGFDPQIDYFQLMEEARNHTVTTRRPIDDDYMSFKLRKPVIDESHSKTTPFKKRKQWWKSKFSFFFNLDWIHRRRSRRKEEEEEEDDVHRARARDFRSGPVYMTGSIGAPNSTRAYSCSGPVRYWDMDLRYVSLRELHMEQQKQKRVRSF